MAKVNVVKRHQYADYLNVGTDATPSYKLMGTGFTSLNENPNAQSESTKYVNEVSSSSEVVSYETQFSFEADQIKEEEAIDALYTVGRNHLVGSDAQFDYVRAELWNPLLTYALTTDTDIVAGKTYYTRTGTDPNYVYTPVETPVKANIGTYYETTPSTTEFEARKFLVSAEISTIEGDNKMKLTGNLNAVGDPKLGSFNVSTKTFTPAS